MYSLINTCNNCVHKIKIFFDYLPEKNKSIEFMQRKKAIENVETSLR